MTDQIQFMDKLIEGLLDQGLLGIIVIGLAWYLLHMQKRHDTEKKELMSMHHEERKEWKEVFKDNVNATKENTGLMASLTKLIETGLNRK